MLSSALRCLRPSTCTLALTRQLTYHMGPVETTIRTKLAQALKPEHLEVMNESHMHAVPAGSESHFRVLVVSPQFEGLSLLQRHRLVNETLREELSTCVHALAIQAKTPQQWSSNPSLAKSPPCMGGSKHDNTMAEKLKAGRDWLTKSYCWWIVNIIIIKYEVFFCTFASCIFLIWSWSEYLIDFIQTLLAWTGYYNKMWFTSEGSASRFIAWN